MTIRKYNDMYYDTGTVNVCVVIYKDSTRSHSVTRQTSMLQSISCHMLEGVWQEMDYSIDVCRVTKWEHVESL